MELPADCAGTSYALLVRYLQRAAGSGFGLTLAALIVFWTVRGTKPTGSAVFPVLYGALAASALIWLIAEGLKLRAEKAAASRNVTMNSLIRRQFRGLKRQRLGGRLLRREADGASGSLTPSDRLRIARETERRVARRIHDPLFRSLDEHDE